MQSGYQVADSGTKSFESGGLNISFRYWHPVQRPLGAVVIVPGFNSHSGYYEWVGNQTDSSRNCSTRVRPKGPWAIRR